MRLREFKQPRQRIDEVAVAAVPLWMWISGLVAAGGGMVAQKTIQDWIAANPGESKVFADEIKRGQDAGALPKDPSKIGDVAFPVVSALSNAWDWLTGGSTTGTKPAQPDDYVKDKNGMLRRKDTAANISKMIGDVIASNTTTFNNKANARKALPSLKDGTVVTIDGKTYKVDPNAGGIRGKEKRGFVPYKDMGVVTGRTTTGQVDDIDDFEVSPSTSADDDDVTTPKPSAGTTGTSWLDSVSDTIGGMFNTVAGAVGGLFGSGNKDIQKTPVPPPNRDINQSGGRRDGAAQGNQDINVGDGSQAAAKQKEKTKPERIPPPIVKPGEIDKGGAGTGDVVRPGDTAGTGAEAGTGAQVQTKTDATTDATTQAQDVAATQTTTPSTQAVQVPPPVTPPPIVVPPTKPKIKTKPYKGQDVFYTGWLKGPPEKIVSLFPKE